MQRPDTFYDVTEPHFRWVLLFFVMSQHQKELLALDPKPWREHSWKLVTRLSSKSKTVMCGTDSLEMVGFCLFKKQQQKKDEQNTKYHVYLNTMGKRV